MREAVIVSAARLPTGKFLGALKSVPVTDLGARVVREAVARAGIEPELVDECIMGNVVSAGAGQAPARQAAIKGGLGDHVAALTINKVCGSGLKAVMLASQGIATGDIDVAVAGGMESMSNCPYMLTRAREGMRMGNGEVLDSMIHDGLWCSLENQGMGLACEAVVERYGVSREDQDAFAAASHHKAARAIRECWVQGRDSARRDPAAPRRSAAARLRRRGAARHQRRGPRQAAAGLQEGRRHGDRGERAGGQRRRGRPSDHGRRQGGGPRPDADGPSDRTGGERARAEVAADDPGRGGSESC